MKYERQQNWFRTKNEFVIKHELSNFKITSNYGLDQPTNIHTIACTVHPELILPSIKFSNENEVKISLFK